MPSFGVTVKTSQVDVAKPSTLNDARSGQSLLTASSSDMSLDGWDGIALEYSVDWPLGLFFTQEIFSK